MGYTTDFKGKIKIDRPLDEETYQYLIKFNETRRMARKLPEKYGVEGEFYVDGGGLFGQGHEKNIIDFNTPPKTQPGLWCHWRPTKNKKAIEWDGGEKFYEYIAWMKYIINNFLRPKGYTLNGEIKWIGEDPSDVGVLAVKDNVVSTELF